MDYMKAYSICCERHCTHKCAFGACTLDCEYDFVVEGIEPSVKQQKEVIKREFKDGKKHNIYPCHEAFNRHACTFFDYVNDHKEEIFEEG